MSELKHPWIARENLAEERALEFYWEGMRQVQHEAQQSETKKKGETQNDTD